MKKIFALSLILLLSCEAKSQQMFENTSLLPINPSRSVVFGKDIVIDDQPDRNQQNFAICSAFNGWLYGVYTYVGETMPKMSLLKSVDNGVTWIVLFDGYGSGASTIIKKVDIIAAGTTIEDLKLFVSMISTNLQGTLSSAFVMRCKAEPFQAEEEIIKTYDLTWDIAIAGDNQYPSPNANPFSIAILIDKRNEDYTDSLIFKSSSNGGLSFDYRKGIATNAHHFGHLQLSYGKTSSQNTGRYYAVWQEREENDSPLGHIYTAHTNPDFNSPFTAPVCLDCQDPSANNVSRYPVIATQYGDNDNDSSNVTSVILYEKYIQASKTFDFNGFYNLQSVTSDYFRPFELTSSAINKIQAAICFNPFDSKFNVTYFDSIAGKLPFLSNDMNFQNPNSWEIISNGYNDQSNLSSPHPAVKISLEKHSAINGWISDGSGGNGVALFDAQYSTYTGINESSLLSNSSMLKVYPNPCVSTVTIEFETRTIENIDITLFDLPGRPVRKFSNQTFADGEHKLGADLSDLPAGSYSCIMRIGNMIVASKIVTIQR